MLLDARDVDADAGLKCDVCIVGGGAAGITLATELAKTSLDVCVLESGGVTPEKETQELYQGEVIGHPYPVAGLRLRFLGGTTNHWAGWCRPLDEIDFEERDWIPHSGWPIGRADLDPYYERAHELCQLERRTYDVDDWARFTRSRPLRPTAGVESTVFQVSPPTRFGTVYRPALERARRTRVVLHANAVRLDLNRASGTVTGVRVATLAGKRFAVEAGQFVLATGAIENARLLLVSNDVEPRGIGNEHDLVGRYFSDHAHIPVASVLLAKGHPLTRFHSLHPTPTKRRAEGLLALTDDLVRSERLLRSCAALMPVPTEPTLESEMRSVARDATGSDFEFGDKRLLDLRTEQAPNPDSRVTLSDEKDALGVPKIRVDWQFTELDKRTWARAVKAIAQGLGAAGVGRLHTKVLDDPDEWSKVHDAAHQMGTTRMHSDPRRGVVDENCLVHGTQNLYIAGNAVFPSIGYANPTLTLLALAVRLAARLRQTA